MLCAGQGRRTIKRGAAKATCAVRARRDPRSDRFFAAFFRACRLGGLLAASGSFYSEKDDGFSVAFCYPAVKTASRNCRSCSSSSACVMCPSLSSHAAHASCSRFRCGASPTGFIARIRCGIVRRPVVRPSDSSKRSAPPSRCPFP